MGCSIGVVAIGLVRDMLKVRAVLRVLRRACGSTLCCTAFAAEQPAVGSRQSSSPPLRCLAPAPLAQAHPNKIALFVPAEITTYCFYPGTHKDFLVSNAIFRMGGAACLMTNKPELYSRCKYELQHSVRVHTGQDDTSFK